MKQKLHTLKATEIKKNFFPIFVFNRIKQYRNKI